MKKSTIAWLVVSILLMAWVITREVIWPSVTSLQIVLSSFTLTTAFLGAVGFATTLFTQHQTAKIKAETKRLREERQQRVHVRSRDDLPSGQSGELRDRLRQAMDERARNDKSDKKPNKGGGVLPF